MTITTGLGSKCAFKTVVNSAKVLSHGLARDNRLFNKVYVKQKQPWGCKKGHCQVK